MYRTGQIIVLCLSLATCSYRSLSDKANNNEDTLIEGMAFGDKIFPKRKSIGGSVESYDSVVASSSFPSENSKYYYNDNNDNGYDYHPKRYNNDLIKSTLPVDRIISTADNFISNLYNSGQSDYYHDNNSSYNSSYGNNDYNNNYERQYNSGSSSLGNYITNVVDNSPIGDFIPPGVTDVIYNTIQQSRPVQNSNSGLGKSALDPLGNYGKGASNNIVDFAHKLITDSYGGSTSKNQYYRNNNNGGYNNNTMNNQGNNICCADCRDGDVQCLSSCSRQCTAKSTCSSAGEGAYAAFCMQRCDVISGQGARRARQQFLPEAACAGQCASQVQRMCRAKACRDYGCTVRDCAAVAPQRCERNGY